MFGVMAWCAEFERNLIRECTAEGITRATAKGTYAQASKLSTADVAQAQAEVGLGLPTTPIAATFGVFRLTLCTALRKAGLSMVAEATVG